jgi:hypothetical protein
MGCCYCSNHRSYFSNIHFYDAQPSDNALKAIQRNYTTTKYNAGFEIITVVFCSIYGSTERLGESEGVLKLEPFWETHLVRRMKKDSN